MQQKSGVPPAAAAGIVETFLNSRRLNGRRAHSPDRIGFRRRPGYEIMTKSIMIVGASSGIGAAAALHFASRGEDLLSVSRSKAAAGDWIAADITSDAGREAIMQRLGDRALDAVLFVAGTWEDGAFTDDYDYLSTSAEENRRILEVKVLAPIELMKALAPNLQKSRNPGAIFIGALSGLDNAASPEVANTASMFGLRGAVQAMRLSLRGKGVGLTVVNPGNVATEEVLDDIAEGRFDEQTPIPLADLMAVIDCVLALSPASEIREINIAQRSYKRSTTSSL